MQTKQAVPVEESRYSIWKKLKNTQQHTQTHSWSRFLVNELTLLG